MSSTHVGESDCQVIMWMGIIINLHRMQCNLIDKALAWPVFFTNSLLDLCNLLQNPCVTFTFLFCRRITKLKIDIGNHGAVPLHAEGLCVCGGGGFLSSTVPLRFTRFSFHLLSNVGEFYRCLANNTPFISPPVDIQINSDNGIFA